MANDQGPVSISRRLSEMLGGQIRVDSRQGQGTTFTVDLPIELPVETPQDRPPVP